MNSKNENQDRKKWLRAKCRVELKLRTSPLSTDEVSEKLLDALAPPGAKQKSQNEEFVTGGFKPRHPEIFRFAGYRQGEWQPAVIDPNMILKPHLVGTLSPKDDETAILYSIDVHRAARTFYALVVGSITLVILGLIFSVTLGFGVPSPAFFAFLIAAISVIFAKGIWDTVPDAILDEQLLEKWLNRSLD